MMTPIDWLTGRKNIVNQESTGINLAIQTINEFENRKFTFKSVKNKYFGVSGQELQKLIREELKNMLIQYRYTTRIKKYTNRKGIPQIKIKLAGKASMMNRYNPFDIKLSIRTES